MEFIILNGIIYITIVSLEDSIMDVKDIVLITENYKGICEHNFLSTVEEFPHTLPTDSWNSYYKRSDISFDFRACKDEADLVSFLTGKYNDQEAFLSSKDWYWCNDFSRVSSKAAEILTDLALRCPELKAVLPEEHLPREKSSLDSKIASAKRMADKLQPSSFLNRPTGEILL